MSADCIFCKIAAGELPSRKIYEDSDTMAFLDIAPVTKGHTLVIPKEHHDPISKVPEELLKKLILTVQKIACAQFKGLKADGMNIAQANGKTAGQLIEHVHFHVIPRYDDSENPKNWIPGSYDNNEEAAATAKRIKEALQ